MSWWRFPRVLGVVVALYLAGMALVFADLGADSSRFDREATATTGTVVALVPRAAAGSAREPSPEVRGTPLAPTVAYEVNGQRYTYTAAHGRYRQRLRVGDTVSLRYRPSAPAQARLANEGRVPVPLITGAFGVAAAGVLVLVVVGPRRGRRTADPGRTSGPTAGTWPRDPHRVRGDDEPVPGAGVADCRSRSSGQAGARHHRAASTRRRRPERAVMVMGTVRL